MSADAPPEEKIYEPLIAFAITNDIYTNIVKTAPDEDQEHTYSRLKDVEASGQNKKVKDERYVLSFELFKGQNCNGQEDDTSSQQVAPVVPPSRRSLPTGTGAAPSRPPVKPRKPPAPLPLSGQQRSSADKSQSPIEARSPPVESPTAAVSLLPASTVRRTSSSQLPDVSHDISGLSTADIAECLHQLKLSKYADAFSDNDVDGRLLMTFDEDLLMGDFGMLRVEARRLIMFAKNGWRPNRDRQE